MLEHHLLRCHNKALIITNVKCGGVDLISTKLESIYTENHFNVFLSPFFDFKDKYAWQDLNENTKCVLIYIGKRLSIEHWFNIVNFGFKVHKQGKRAFNVKPKLVFISSQNISSESHSFNSRFDVVEINAISGLEQKTTA